MRQKVETACVNAPLKYSEENIFWRRPHPSNLILKMLISVWRYFDYQTNYLRRIQFPYIFKQFPFVFLLEIISLSDET